MQTVCGFGDAARFGNRIEYLQGFKNSCEGPSDNVMDIIKINNYSRCNASATIGIWKTSEGQNMLLYYSNTSPYARKVRLVVIEKGLNRLVQSVVCNPFVELPALSSANPLHRVPTLVTDEGFSLYDSPVICAYLDQKNDENRLIPESGSARWDVLRWEAMTDGLLDAAYNIVMERKRSQKQQSMECIEHWQGEIKRVLDRAEQGVGNLSSSIVLSHLALGTGLGYLDFRLPEMDWRERCPSLREWYEVFAQRPSMQETQPV